MSCMVERLTTSENRSITSGRTAAAADAPVTDVTAIPMDATMNHVRDMAEPDAFRKALNVRQTHVETATEMMADVDLVKR